MEIDIVKILSKKPSISFSELQSHANITSQRLVYYLNKLVEKGIVYYEKNGSKKLYSVQLAFMHYDEIIDHLKPFLKSFSNHIYTNGDHDPEEVFIKSLELFFETYIFEIQK